MRFVQQNYIFIVMLPKLKKLVFEVQFQQSESPYQGRSADAFLAKFNQLRQMLLSNLQEFVPIDVVARQPPSHLIIASGRFNRNIYLDRRKNKLVEFPRKNSFEIYVDNFHLFSRLETGNWPDISAICEWALRVAEKMVDLQIEKQEAPLKEQLQMIGKDGAISPIPHIPNEKLPPVSRGLDKTIRNKPEKSQLSNFYPRSRYSSLRDDDTVLPYGVDPMNTTSTQRRQYFAGANRTKGKAKSIDRELKTISRDFYERPKQPSFHWNLKQKQVKPIFSGRYHEALFNNIEAKTANVQLSPLPAVHDKLLDQISQVNSHIKNEMIELRLSDSSLNIYNKFYRIQGNKVVKISGDQIWGPILCETPLPLIGEYSFQMTVFNSSQNQIQLGIAPLNYYPHAGREKPDILVSFNCGSGQIKDAKHASFASETHWREGGVKTTLNAAFCLKATVNTKAKIIQWYVNDTIAASAKLPSQFNTGFRAFISLYHIRDAVVLNQSTLNDLTFTERQLGVENASIQTGAVQEGINTDEIAMILPITQNRILPNIKQREVLPMPMIDESIQTAPFFQGRIKKQRLHRFLEKQTEKATQQAKEVFSIDDVKTYKTILANQSAHQSEGQWKANPNQHQKPEPVSSQIHLVIHDQQTIKKPQQKFDKVQEKNNISDEKIDLPQQEKQEINEKKVVEEQLKQQIKIQHVPNSSEQQSSASPPIEIAKILQTINEQPTNSPQQQSPTQQMPKQQNITAITRVETSITPPHQSEKKLEEPQSQPIEGHHQVQNQVPKPANQQQNEISQPQDAIQWEGSYQEGAFKLKNISP